MVLEMGKLCFKLLSVITVVEEPFYLLERTILVVSEFLKALAFDDFWLPARSLILDAKAGLSFVISDETS